MKNTNIIIGLALLFLPILNQAQTPYRTLDSLCAAIRSFQSAANWNISTEEGKSFELGFVSDNFNVFSYNRLASHSVYKKTGETERLYITENIDLSKATSVEFIPTQDKVATIRLWFPAGHLKTQVYEEGRVIETANPLYLNLYLMNHKGYKNNTKNYDYWVNYKTVVQLCHLLQLEKGLISKDYITEAAKQFDNVLDDTKTGTTDEEQFLARYKDKTPPSLYYAEVKKQLEEEQTKEKIRKEQEAEKQRIEAEKLKQEMARLDKIRQATNLKEFMALGFQGGTFGRFGLVMEINSNKKVGGRMAFRAGFMKGESSGYMASGYYPTSETKTSQYGIELGPMFRLTNFFHAYTCLGFAGRTVWTKYKSASGTGTINVSMDGEVGGLATTLGGMVRLGRVVNLNLGVLFFNFSEPELTYGIAFNLYPEF